jgi:glucose-6-phosphate isomerase
MRATTMKDLSPLSGLALRLDEERLSLSFGPGLLHPNPETRHLDDVRPMLEDPHATGPNHLYTIYMDLCRQADASVLREQGLLYGAMVYNRGALGAEYLRSQSHLHSKKVGTSLRYSEVFEFWTGRGFLYLQRECGPEVSRAYLVRVEPGDRIVLPFGWVHLVITTGEDVLSFGAWCARQNSFEYHALRELGGPAHFVHADGSVASNPHYRSVPDVQYATPRDFPDLGIPRERPIYDSWRDQPELFAFVANPELVGDIWKDL